MNWTMNQPNSMNVRRTFHRNGRVYREVPTLGENTHGVVKEWHKNGVLAAEISMKSGFRHGICKQWNEKRKFLGSYKMNRGTGVSRRWHSNGQLHFEAHMIRDVFNGRLRVWNEDGELEREEFYVDAQKLSEHDYLVACITNKQLPVYDDDKEDTTPRAKLSARLKNRTDHERLIDRLLQKPLKAEAMQWLKGSKPSAPRTLGHFGSTQDSVRFVKELYDLGASEVLAVDIENHTDGKQNTEKLVVLLPPCPHQRQAIFAWCEEQGEEMAFSPEKDSGEKQLYILLD